VLACVCKALIFDPREPKSSEDAGVAEDSFAGAEGGVVANIAEQTIRSRLKATINTQE
jgi:hypothetical protein